MRFPVVMPLGMNLSALVSYWKGSDAFRDLVCDPLGLRLGWLAFPSFPCLHTQTPRTQSTCPHVNTTLRRYIVDRGLCLDLGGKAKTVLCLHRINSPRFAERYQQGHQHSPWASRFCLPAGKTPACGGGEEKAVMSGDGGKGLACGGREM